MIVKEFYRQRKDGVNLYKTYSNNGLKIQNEKTGAVYSEAIDVENSTNSYTETDEPIETEVTVEDKAQAYDILMGVSE